MGQLFGHDFGQVQVHTGSTAAEPLAQLGADAATLGNRIAFARNRSSFQASFNQRLLVHELAHVVQQTGGTAGPSMTGRALEDDADKAVQDVLANRPVHAIAANRTPNRPAYQFTTIDVELISDRDSFAPAGGAATYNVGDTAATSVLMNIVETTSGVTFQWFNFSLGEAQTGTWQDWDFRVGAAIIGGNSGSFSAIGRQLTARQWRSLWPDPRAELLRMHEAGQLSFSHDATVELYRGMIHSEAQHVLDENEASVDALLNGVDRLQFYQEYAAGLREASVVRDVLLRNKSDIERSLVQQQGFSFGMAGRTINMDPHHRLDLARRLGAIEQSLLFWQRAFPLLTRLQTEDIRASSVEATLRAIKANIIATRTQLAIAPQGRANFDLWDLDQVRARIDPRLGPRATRAIADEDASRRRWGLARAGLMFAGGIALLFVPGGAFIDLAIGVSMGVEAWDRAQALGQAAKTGIHVDDALVSQAATNAAEFEAILATIFAAIGVAGMSLRVLRFGRVLLNVRRAAPTMEITAQVRVARVLADNPGWLRPGRNVEELNQAITRAGSALRFEERQLLRAVIYQAQGHTLPAQSRESLDELLLIVWNQNAQLAERATRIRTQRDRIIAEAAARGDPPPHPTQLPDPSEAIYRLYSGATEPNLLTRPSADYLRETAEIARGRPAGAVSNLQSGLRGNLAELADAGRLAGSTVERTFLRFERAGANLTNVTERIYLNVRADVAPRVMRTVVREIVDDGAQFPGVAMAKLAGPGAVAGRSESIVIYLQDAASVQRVMQRLRAYHSANPELFQRTTPFMTNRIVEGISVAAEPVGAGGASFGQVRSRAILQAMEASMARGETQEQFVQRTLAALRNAGVDPRAPHLNLPAEHP